MKSSIDIKNQINDLKVELKNAEAKEREEFKKVGNAYSIEFTQYLLNKLKVKSWKDINLKAFVDNLEPFEVIEPANKSPQEYKNLIKEMRNARKNKTRKEEVEMKTTFSSDLDM